MEVEKINRKKTAISLILLTTLAATVGALTITAFAAADTDSTTINTGTAVTAYTSQYTNQMQFGGNMMMNNQGFGGFGGGPRGHGGRVGGFMGDMANIEVSSEYTANVNAILNSDTDVQSLISQGYNVTSINPIIKNVIEADGTLATKATTAIVMMQNGTSGYATVKVDIANSQVTQIATITRTVIDRSEIENHQLNQLTSELKQQMLKEIRENQPEKSINSCWAKSSPGEIRTLVKGSRIR